MRASRGSAIEVSWEAFHMGQPELEVVLFEAAMKLGVVSPEPPKLLFASLRC